MSTTTSTSAMGRILALLIALILALIASFVWQAVDRDRMVMAETPSAEALTGLSVTPAIQDCIDKRSAEINALVDQGLYTRERADADIVSARNLCIQQDATPRATQF